MNCTKCGKRKSASVGPFLFGGIVVFDAAGSHSLNIIDRSRIRPEVLSYIKFTDRLYRYCKHCEKVLK